MVSDEMMKRFRMIQQRYAEGGTITEDEFDSLIRLAALEGAKNGSLDTSSINTLGTSAGP